MNGILRTPLPPLTIFLDDPLRVLRVLRFASRFSFIPTRSILTAASTPQVKDALFRKVSRERIGQELLKAFSAPSCHLGYCMDLLAALNAVDAVVPKGMLYSSWYYAIGRRIKAKSSKNFGSNLNLLADRSQSLHENDVYSMKGPIPTTSPMLKLEDAISQWNSLPEPTLFSGGSWNSTATTPTTTITTPIIPSVATDRSISVGHDIMSIINTINRYIQSHPSSSTSLRSVIDISASHRTSLGFALTLLSKLDSAHKPPIPLFDSILVDIPTVYPVDIKGAHDSVTMYGAIHQLPYLPWKIEATTSTTPTTPSSSTTTTAHPYATNIEDSICQHSFKLSAPVNLSHNTQYLIQPSLNVDITSHSHPTGEYDQTAAKQAYLHLFKHISGYPQHIRAQLQSMFAHCPRYFVHAPANIIHHLFSTSQVWWRPSTLPVVNLRKIITDDIKRRVLITTTAPTTTTTNTTDTTDDASTAVIDDDKIVNTAMETLTEVLHTANGHNKRIYSLLAKNKGNNIPTFNTSLSALLAQSPVEFPNRGFQTLFNLFPPVLTVYSPNQYTYMDDIKHLLVFSLRLHSNVAVEVGEVLTSSKWLSQTLFQWLLREIHIKGQSHGSDQGVDGKSNFTFTSNLGLSHSGQSTPPVSLLHDCVDEINRIHSIFSEVRTHFPEHRDGNLTMTVTPDTPAYNTIKECTKTSWSQLYIPDVPTTHTTNLRPLSPSLLALTTWSCHSQDISSPVLLLACSHLTTMINDAIEQGILTKHDPLLKVKQACSTRVGVDTAKHTTTQSTVPSYNRVTVDDVTTHILLPFLSFLEQSGVTNIQHCKKHIPGSTLYSVLNPILAHYSLVDTEGKPIPSCVSMTGGIIDHLAILLSLSKLDNVQGAESAVLEGWIDTLFKYEQQRDSINKE